MENHEKHGYILWIIVAIVLTGILVGGGVYYWQNQKASEEKSDLSSQIRILQQQIEVLKTENPIIADSSTANPDETQDSDETICKALSYTTDCKIDKKTLNHASGGAANHYFLAVKINGQWAEIYGTQDGYGQCYVLWQYNFPKDIWGTCDDYGLNKSVAYDKQLASVTDEITYNKSDREAISQEIKDALYPDCANSFDEAAEGQCIFQLIAASQYHASGVASKKQNGINMADKHWYAINKGNQWERVSDVKVSDDNNYCSLLWQYSFPMSIWKSCYTKSTGSSLQMHYGFDILR